jgi:gamma-glutamylcyclotransferase (GGCT)/AIG2-like uncharacterized protein YtfP
MQGDAAPCLRVGLIIHVNRMNATNLFVYGSLKRDLQNHFYLAGQEFVATARTVPIYRLYRWGAYPGLVAVQENGVAVRGELYRVDEETLRRLDVLEDVPHLYQRGPVQLEGMGEPVIAYFYVRDVSAAADCGDAWPP